MRRRFLSTWFLLVVLGVAGCDGGDRAWMEPTLRNHLKVLRDLIDQYRGDHGHPPPTIDALVDQGYIRLVPFDPITRRNDTWIEVREPGEGCAPAGIVNVHSGATGRARDGTFYADW